MKTGYLIDMDGVIYRENNLIPGATDFVQFYLEPQLLGEARLGYEHILDPTMLEPRIGVDESGKGDFFGPLVVAGVFVNEASTTRAPLLPDVQRRVSSR